MIEYVEVKPCAEVVGALQVEGSFRISRFILNEVEVLLNRIHFKTFSVGDRSLICKRSDCLLFISSDGSFNLTEVSNNESVKKILHEIEEMIKG